MLDNCSRIIFLYKYIDIHTNTYTYIQTSTVVKASMRELRYVNSLLKWRKQFLPSAQLKFALKDTRQTLKTINGNRTPKMLLEGSPESELTKFRYSFNWISAADNSENWCLIWRGGMAKRKVYKHITVEQWTRSLCLVQFNQYGPCDGFIGPVVILVQSVFCVSCVD